jgi:hypothetical protein
VTYSLDLEKHPNLKIKDLQDESNVPYELNFVQVEAGAGSAPLVARLACFEKSG